MARNVSNRKTSVRFSGRGGRQPGRGTNLWRGLLRWLFYITLSVLTVFLIGMALHGIRRLLFVRNPHFLIREIQVTVYGDLRREAVLRQLADSGVVEAGKSMIFGIDLKDVREEVEGMVSVNRVVVRRRLPGTLIVDVYERRPIAQLGAPRGLLVDNQGLLLPSRNDPKTWLLPVVTGVRNVVGLKTGGRLEDELVQRALLLLQLIGTESYREFLDINLIQLNYADNTLRVFLRARPPFRDGACIILPAESRFELAAALDRVEVISRERLRGRQITGFIDATYKINVPVRP